MGLKLIQKVGNSTASTDTLNLTMTPTQARNLIVVLVAWVDTTLSISSIVDNAPGGGNLYTQITNSKATDATTNQATEIWMCKMCYRKARTITITLSNASALLSCWAFEVSGADIDSLQQTGVVTNPTASATPTGGSVTTTNSLDFIASVIAFGSNITGIHAGNSFTLGTIVSGNASAYMITRYSGIGTYAPQWDGDTSANFCSSTVSFKEVPHNIDMRKSTLGLILPSSSFSEIENSE